MYSDKIRPYEGNEPYIFISYSHKDDKLVLSIIERMAQDGYRIWYDEGITPGTEWDDEIALHIEKCDCFIAFISNNYLNSENCKDELNFVRDLGKERLLLYIEEVKLPPGMAMRFNRLQHINLYDYGQNVERFFEKLYMAQMLKKSKEDKLTRDIPLYSSIPFVKPQPTLEPLPKNLFGPGSKSHTTPIDPKHITDSRYTLIQKIGIGGMAKAYKAKDNQTNKFVTVKFFSKYSFSNCPFFTDNRLYNTIKELNHPNLCKILDAGEITTPYLVMEYIDGVTIDNYLKDTYCGIELDFKELLLFCRQILEALFLLHRNHIFYGDVSPYNIILSKNKQASLIDYTECNFIGSPNPMTTLVSAQFISPEKLNADTLDHRSDIYEFGGLLEKLLHQYINTSHVSYSHETIDIYETPLFDIVRKAMKKNPDDRYQSALEMLEAIDKIIDEYT